MHAPSEIVQEIAKTWHDETSAPLGGAFVSRVFWAMASHVVQRLLKQQEYPNQIRIGRARRTRTLSSQQWQLFEAELGLDKPDTATVIRACMRRVFQPDSSKSRPGCAIVLGGNNGLAAHLVGLVLVTIHLKVVIFPKRRRSYEYSFRELGVAARRMPEAFVLKDFNELEAAKAISGLAGATRFQFSADFFKDPFFEYFLPLHSSMARDRSYEPPDSGAEENLPEHSVKIPTRDYLVAALAIPVAAKKVDAESADKAPHADSDAAVDLLREDVFRLRSELLKLHASRDALTHILAPFLEIPQPPADALRTLEESCVAEALVMVRNLRHLVEEKQVEFIGSPGQALQLELPNDLYQLPEGYRAVIEPGTPVSLRLLRRGLRVGGAVLQAAMVIPASDTRKV